MFLRDSTASLARSGQRNVTSTEFRKPLNIETPWLFVVKHPVTVTIGTWSVCLMAETYSPVPVTLSESKCPIRPTKAVAGETPVNQEAAESATILVLKSLGNSWLVQDG